MDVAVIVRFLRRRNTLHRHRVAVLRACSPTHVTDEGLATIFDDGGTLLDHIGHHLAGPRGACVRAVLEDVGSLFLRVLEVQIISH